MPSKERENRVNLQCSACKRITHFTRKNKKTLKNKLELNRHCKFCKKHTLHKETK